MSPNPFLERIARRRTGDAGRASEKRTAGRLSADLVPYSGAKAHRKGDMKKGRFLIESKSTSTDRLRLDIDWLCKIIAEARVEGMHPAVTVTFTHPSGAPVQGGKWVLVTEEDFARMVADAPAVHTDASEHG